MIIKFVNTNFKFVKILKILSKIVNIFKKKMEYRSVLILFIYRIII